ncbi:MAG: helix-turn-helix transcriptional regulator, partial [Pseudonocardiaceae bacterium]
HHMNTHPVNQPTPADTPARTLLTVEEAAHRLSIGRTTMYALLKARAIESIRVGRRLRRVPADTITDYVARLAAEQRPDVA